MVNMVMDGVSPRSRSTDPVTSVEAGRGADLNASQRQVLTFLESFTAYPGLNDWTDKEFVSAIQADVRRANGVVYTEQRYRSARSELGDRILFTGDRRDGCRVWRLNVYA